MGADTNIQGAGLITPQIGLSGSTDNTKIAFTRGSLKYDSPFVDMTSTFIPRTIKSIMRFIAAYVLGESLIAQCIAKMSEYPITKLLYKDENDEIIKDDKTIDWWKDFLEKKLKLLRTLKQAGMDYYAYGNSIISINYPFKRMLKCGKCGVEHAAEALKVKFRGFKFYAQCPKCRYEGEMKARDLMTRELGKFSIVHWDIMNIDIKYNGITGDHFFYYTIPPDIANAIRRGDMDIIKGTRLEVIEAVRRRKQLKLMADNVYHLKRPAPQYIIPSERGWGIPVVMPVMKDIFHIRILKKGNEMIAFDHIVPLRLLFPQGTGDVSPHATINLSSWKGKIEAEIQKWRVDPNYVSIVPIPLGMQNFAGDARLLMVTPEIKAIEDNIITGIGIIPEIIRGGASWSGSNVSLRVVENTFLNHRNDIQGLMDFIVDNISTYLDKPRIQLKMSDFKMADDMAKKQMMLSAAMAPADQALVSQTTATRELGFEPIDEYEQIQKDVKRRIELKIQVAEGDAEAAGSASVINAMYQADAQMENQNRLEKNQGETQQMREEQNAKRGEENAIGIQEEVGQVAGMQGQDPNMVSIPNLILILTNRFARLATVDQNEFKIRMLAMKNSTPNLYQEVFTNMKEMNLIAADLLPDLAVTQKYTPGQIPTNMQGDQYAEQAPNAAEVGASPAAAIPIQTMPESRPPRADGVNQRI